MLQRIIQQFDLQLDTIHEVDDSHSSTVYRCQLSNNEYVFLKIPYSNLKFQRELEAYHILKGIIPIPELLDSWSGDEEIPGALLLSALKGQPLSENDSQATAYQVGVVHASMHGIEPPHPLHTVQNEFANWPLFIEKQFYSFAEDVKEIIDDHLFKKALNKFEFMKNQLPKPDGPSFIHMDFRPANIIINNGNVSGIIDFESVRFGATEVDFTKLYRDYLSYDEKLLQAYTNGYNSVRPLVNLEIVLPFYRFTDAFNSIGWCKRRGLEKNKRFLMENITSLNQLLG